MLRMILAFLKIVLVEKYQNIGNYLYYNKLNNHELDNYFELVIFSLM